MSCTNFTAPLIQRMYSLAVKRQSKASYRGLLDLLAVHFKGRENKDIANIWCNILRTAFSWKNQSDTNGFFHTTFSLVDIPSVTFLYQTSPVYPLHIHWTLKILSSQVSTEEVVSDLQKTKGQKLPWIFTRKQTRMNAGQLSKEPLKFALLIHWVNNNCILVTWKQKCHKFYHYYNILSDHTQF